MKLPRKVPFIVLRGTVLFPQELLPLHIFEDQYKKVLDIALERDRMLAVVMPRRNVDKFVHSDQLSRIGCLGLIRAAVTEHNTGDSNLVLEGLVRVELTTDYPEEGDQPIANIKKFRDTDEGEEALIEDLNLQMLQLCQEFQNRGLDLPETVTAYLSQVGVEEPICIVDLIASQPFFVADPFDRQELLEISSVPERITRLIQHMKRALQ